MWYKGSYSHATFLDKFEGHNLLLFFAVTGELVQKSYYNKVSQTFLTEQLHPGRHGG